MEINAKIEGLDEFLKRIGELSVQKVLNKSIKKSIFTLEREAKINTPVKEGILRNSYETKFKDLEGRLRNFREYAIFVHEGHKQEVGRYVPALGRRLVQPFVKGNPWMTRTLSESENRINAIFQDDIQEFLNDLTK